MSLCSGAGGDGAGKGRCRDKAGAVLGAVPGPGRGRDGAGAVPGAVPGSGRCRPAMAALRGSARRGWLRCPQPAALAAAAALAVCAFYYLGGGGETFSSATRRLRATPPAPAGPGPRGLHLLFMFTKAERNPALRDKAQAALRSLLQHGRLGAADVLHLHLVTEGASRDIGLGLLRDLLRGAAFRHQVRGGRGGPGPRGASGELCRDGLCELPAGLCEQQSSRKELPQSTAHVLAASSGGPSHSAGEAPAAPESRESGGACSVSPSLLPVGRFLVQPSASQLGLGSSVGWEHLWHLHLCWRGAVALSSAALLQPLLVLLQHLDTRTTYLDGFPIRREGWPDAGGS